MNIKEAMKCLEKKGVPNHLYSFNSLGAGMSIFIGHDWEPDEGWTVAFSEQGYRHNIKKFLSESDACSFFVRDVMDYARESGFEINDFEP